MTLSTSSAPFEGPKSLTDLFLSLTSLSMQGFGGVFAIAQRELVDHKRWLSNEEFVEEWAVAQALPGPNILNMTLLLGARYFGWRGALTALAGMLCLPLLLIVLVVLLYGQYAHYPEVAGAVRGMGAVAAGLIMASGIRLFDAFKTHPLGLAVCITLGTASFLAVGILRLPLIYALVGLGGLGYTLVYRKLGE